MSRRVLRPRVDICQLCDFMRAARQSPLIQPCRSGKAFNSARTFSTTRRAHAQKSSFSNSAAQAALNTLPRPVGVSKSHHIPSDVSQAELEQRLQEARATCEALLALKRVPSERETLLALLQCNSLAEALVIDPPSLSSHPKDGAASALLSLDTSSRVKKIPHHKLPPSFQPLVDELSNIAFSVVKHPPVFITPDVLEIYTRVQSSLRKPRTFPEVFSMYANKPLPEESSFPIRYRKQNANKVSNAITVSIANRALQAAIDDKELIVAMDIIESTYATKSFRKAKFIRQCLMPVAALAMVPVAAYAAAMRLALLQTNMDSSMATNVAFTGIVAYVGFTAALGVVTISTANDQMDRVTWAQGIPLRERWIREDERAAIDKVAGSWGFREIWRRGEEGGEDWDTLREWIGRKGMMLDRVALMEGME